MVIWLKNFQSLVAYGLRGITKTLITGILMQSNEQYVRTFKELEGIFTDDDDYDDSRCMWGCGRMVGEVRMSFTTWYKVLYVV